jgi:pentapeptide MXKDX repeat protein
VRGSARLQVPALLRRTLRRRAFAEDSDNNTTNPDRDRFRAKAEKRLSRVRYRGKAQVNNRRELIVRREAAKRRFQKPSQKDDRSMTFRSRIAPGIATAVVSLGLALAPAALAQDKMGKDDGMKKDTMSKDTMSKDAMKKDDGMKKDGMKNDAMKDGMKKDEGMKKN